MQRHFLKIYHFFTGCISCSNLPQLGNWNTHFPCRLINTNNIRNFASSVSIDSLVDFTFMQFLWSKYNVTWCQDKLLSLSRKTWHAQRGVKSKNVLFRVRLPKKIWKCNELFPLRCCVLSMSCCELMTRFAPLSLEGKVFIAFQIAETYISRLTLHSWWASLCKSRRFF